MDEQELREKMAQAMSQCYSKEFSACSKHPVFMPQKAITLILTIIKEVGMREIRWVVKS